MEFYDVIRNRCSIRSFQDKPVPQDAITRIQEAILLAPTACNKQPFKVIFVTDPDLLNKIVMVYNRKWLAEAPMIAVVAGNAATCWNRLEGDPIFDVDCAIVMEHLVLSAAAEGLGSCWICAYDRKALDTVLGLDAPWKSVAITPIGYPKTIPTRPVRKDASELFEVR